MAEINLTQEEADSLISMPKVCADREVRDFPPLNQSLSIPLLSEDGRESFTLDITLGRINLSKITYQSRGRQVVVLVRLDIDGPPHRNPDGKEIACPHLHYYREGFGDKWAEPVPIDKFSTIKDYWQTLHDFMEYCSVVVLPEFRKGLF